jgi:hypothetical protein
MNFVRRRKRAGRGGHRSLPPVSASITTTTTTTDLTISMDPRMIDESFVGRRKERIE